MADEGLDILYLIFINSRYNQSIPSIGGLALQPELRASQHIMGPGYPSQFMGSPDRAPNPLLALLPESLRSSTSINRGGSFLFSAPGFRPFHEQEQEPLSSQPRRPYLAQIATLRMDPDPRYDDLPSSPSPFIFPIPLPSLPQTQMPVVQLRLTQPEDSRVKRLEELMAGRGQTKGHVGVMRKTHE